jgi:hypothetical protein
MQHDQDVNALHHRAQKLLARKLEPLTTRVAGPLSLRDIYEATSKTVVVSAPPQFQLDWYLANFDKIEKLKRPVQDKHGKGFMTHAGLVDKKVISLYKKHTYVYQDLC